MINFYEAFNLKIRSDNLKLPELNPIKESNNFDILIKEAEISFDEENSINIYNTNFIKFYPHKVILKVNNICLFKIANGNSIFWQKLNKKVEEDDIRTFLLGSAIGSLLIQRDIIVLHGNALEKSGKAIICLGHSGTGKSTIAYSLMQQGWNLIADDLVAIDNNYQILPGIPRIKLWRDAALCFRLDINKLKPIRNNLNKYVIQGNQVISNRKCYPLHCLYLLERNISGGTFSNIKNIKMQSEKATFLRLKNHLYRNRFIKGLGKENDLFMKLVNLQKKAPTIRLPMKTNINEMSDWLLKNDLSNSNFWIS